MFSYDKAGKFRRTLLKTPPTASGVSSIGRADTLVGRKADGGHRVQVRVLFPVLRGDRMRTTYKYLVWAVAIPLIPVVAIVRIFVYGVLVAIKTVNSIGKEK